MGPNSDQEEDLSRIKSAYYLVIGVLLLAALTRAVSTTPKKTSQADANDTQCGREPAFVLAEKPIKDLIIKGSDKVIRLMLNINRDLAITFTFATYNEQFTVLACRLFELFSGELSETLAA
jgi:predicted ABC-type transport system involved in lysophospholipase L1 biosynthesis ATPase subunit